MGFDSLDLRRHYNSDQTDPLSEFYAPVLKLACQYDRAVGYFSSSTFRACAAELGNFVANGGQIRLVVGCMVADADIQALKQSGQANDAHERAKLREEVQRYLLELQGSDPQAAQTFAKLIVRISAIVDAHFRLIVDGKAVLPWAAPGRRAGTGLNVAAASNLKCNTLPPR